MEEKRELSKKEGREILKNLHDGTLVHRVKLSDAIEEIIELNIDGVTVKGKSWRIASDINIEMLEPYSGYKDYMHIPCFAFDYADNFLGEKGRKTTESMLKNLYRIRNIAETKKEILKIAYINYSEEINNLLDEFNNKGLEEKEMELKKQFRAKHIEQRDYQNGLKLIRKEKRDFEFSIFGLWEKHFAEHFDEIIPVLLREQLIKTIGDNCK